jgi:hypothetical protein
MENLLGEYRIKAFPHLIDLVNMTVAFALYAPCATPSPSNPCAVSAKPSFRL